MLSLEYLQRSTFSQSSVNQFKLFSPQFDTPESLHPQKPWSVVLSSTTLSNHFHTPHSSGIRGEVHEPAGNLCTTTSLCTCVMQWSPCQGSVLLMTQELRSGLHPQIHHMTILHQSNENLTKSGKTDTNPYHRIPASYSILHTNHAGSTDDARSPNKPMQNSFSRIIEQDRKHKAAVVPRSIQPHHSGRVSRNLTPPHQLLESREPRNIVLSKFCSEIDRKFDVRLIPCVYGTLDHIDCLKHHSCCLVSPVFVDCNILIGQKCPLMHQSELLMVVIELYFQQNYDSSAKISALICYVLSKF